jgi:hypothetical protein
VGRAARGKQRVAAGATERSKREGEGDRAAFAGSDAEDRHRTSAGGAREKLRKRTDGAQRRRVGGRVPVIQRAGTSGWCW